MLSETLASARRLVPGLVEVFERRGLMELEQSGSAAIAQLFRDHGAPGLLIASASGGSGATLTDCVRVLRLVGARCPSLAIMMTMHGHSVAAFVHGAVPVGASESLLRRVAGERLLVASAFAEARPGADILDSTVRCVADASAMHYRLSGSKKPCSMSREAAFALVGITLDAAGESSRGLAVVDMAASGVRQADFWVSPLLSAAGSHCVIFDDVAVDPALILPGADMWQNPMKGKLRVAHAEVALSCLFQLMASAAYLGMAARLCEIVLARRCGQSAERIEMLSRIESAALAIDHLALVLQSGKFSTGILAKAMLVLCATADQIDQIALLAGRMLGGGGYLADAEVHYLMLVTKCIRFHPPSASVRTAIVEGCYLEDA